MRTRPTPSSTTSVPYVSNAPQPSAPVRVGVVGAGQLARMMGDEAHACAVQLSVLAVSKDEPAVATADVVVLGEPTDPLALARLADGVDVVTFDHELVDLDQIDALEALGVVVRPSAAALRYAVDKAFQRRAFFEAGFAVPRFLVTDTSDDPRVATFLESIEGPPVLKVARGGYDGRGVLFPRSHDEALSMIEELGTTVVIEERLRLDSEVAQVVVRGVDGSVRIYPLVTTVQSEGMCVEVRYPSGEDAALEGRAAAIGERIAELTGAVGVVAIEFFVVAGELLINEVALRPHNSGHWTIEGAATSQFANHLLAVSGQELGEVDTNAKCVVMVNIVGAKQPASPEAARSVEGARVHDYGKAWRPGRKLGHVTALGDDPARVHVTAWNGARAYGTRTREA